MTGDHDDHGDHDDQLAPAVQASVVRRRGRVVSAGTAVLAVLVGLAVLDGAGVVDAVGPDVAVVEQRAGPSTLTVRHPSVTRPALASPLEITIEQDGGFDGTVDVAVSSGYLLAWDLNGILPAPAGETADGHRTIWTFDTPDGEVLTIRYEARIEPARQSDARGRVAVLDDGGAEVVAVELTTRIRP